MKTWYSIKAQGEDAANIDIFDDIGLWGITAKQFIGDLKALDAVKNINLRINSYGGDLFDGITIYNALKYYAAQVNVTIYCIAASIASVIAMAGDKISMPENTFMFVRNPAGLAGVFAFADAVASFCEVFPSASYVLLGGENSLRLGIRLGDLAPGPKDMLEAYIAAFIVRKIVQGRGQAVGGGVTL